MRGREGPTGKLGAQLADPATSDGLTCTRPLLYT